MLDDSEIERILVVTAHPDDLDFGAGGTIGQWTDAGIAVSYCLCTDGNAGGFDPTVSRDDMARIRREEQAAAGAVLGVRDLHFLGFQDGALEVTMQLRHDIARVIRQVRPQRVVCQSPVRNMQRIYSSHPDHIAAGEAAHCAVYPDARNPFAHPDLLLEGLEEWAVPELWVMGYPEPNHWVDVTDSFERKKQALQCHASQMVNIPDLDGMLRGWGTLQAQAAGLPEGRIAEGFLVVDTR